MKNIEKINDLIGSIWEELNEDGLDRYQAHTNLTKPTEQWLRMNKKFDKVFELLQKEIKK